MPSENADTLRRAFAAYESEGVEGLLKFVDPGFEMTTTPGLAAEPQTYRGHDGLRRYFDSFLEIMDGVRFEPQEVIDAGEHVVMPVRLVATGRSTGIETHQHLVIVWTLEDGKAVRAQPYATKEEALAALGR